MASPVIGMMGMGASAGGGALGGISQIMGGFAQSKQSKYQAGIAKMNAEISRQNAEYAIRAGEGEAKILGRKTGQIIGQQKAAQGASGLDVNFGSPTQVRESQHMVGMEDQTQVRENAGRRAYGHFVEAAGFDASAKALMAKSKQDVVSGFVGGFGSFLGTAGSVASKWYQGNQVGLWGSGGVTRDTVLGPSSNYSRGDDMPTNYGDY